MPVTLLILAFFILAVFAAVVGFLTRRRVFYAVALLFGALAILMSLGIALTLSRM